MLHYVQQVVVNFAFVPFGAWRAVYSWFFRDFYCSLLLLKNPTQARPFGIYVYVYLYIKTLADNTALLHVVLLFWIGHSVWILINSRMHSVN